MRGPGLGKAEWRQASWKIRSADVEPSTGLYVSPLQLLPTYLLTEIFILGETWSQKLPTTPGRKPSPQDHSKEV